MIYYFASNQDNLTGLVPIQGPCKKNNQKAHREKNKALLYFLDANCVFNKDGTFNIKKGTKFDMNCFLYTCEELSEQNSGYTQNTFARIIKKEYVNIFNTIKKS